MKVSRTAVKALGLGLVMIVLAGDAAASAQTTVANPFGCRASVARLSVLSPLLNLEPIVANKPITPCVTDFHGVTGTVSSPAFSLGPVTATAVYAATHVDSPAPLKPGQGAYAVAGLANVNITLGTTTVHIDAVDTTATQTCVAGNTHPVTGATSRIVNLSVNGTAIAVPPNNAPFTLSLGALGSLTFNQIMIAGGPDHATARAVVLTTPLLSLVLAESYAQKAQNTQPCSLT